MAEPSQEELERLLALQAADHRARKVRHQLDDLAEQQQLDAAQERLAELEREQDDVRVEADAAASRQRQLEREVDVLTQRRTAEQTRLYDGTVHTARELKAVEAEVEATERLISEHEDQLLEVLEQVEALQAQLDGLEARAAEEQEAVRTLTQARDEAAKGLLAELGELEADRARRAGEIDGELLARYEKAAQRGGGTGVGRLEDNACTACRLTLSMADVGDLLAGPPLTTCPQCRRLLVVPA